MVRAGRLFVVATPIGNLGDVTLRAVETLREVDAIVAEDTRRTRALLSHLDIRGKTLVSIDAHADEIAIGKIVASIERGSDVALVTDSGTPSVSDPGAVLVRAAVRHDLIAVSVPGPSAVTAAVALSGLVSGPFLFLGFLPRRGRKREQTIRRIADTAEPVVLFEAPVRAAATLVDLAEAMPDRDAVVARELTKVHEETVRGRLQTLAAGSREWRGEVTIVIGPTRTAVERVGADTLDKRIEELLGAGESAKDVSIHLAAWSGRPRREVYARVLELKRRFRTTLSGL